MPLMRVTLWPCSWQNFCGCSKILSHSLHLCPVPFCSIICAISSARTCFFSKWSKCCSTWRLMCSVAASACCDPIFLEADNTASKSIFLSTPPGAPASLQTLAKASANDTVVVDDDLLCCCDSLPAAWPLLLLKDASWATLGAAPDGAMACFESIVCLGLDLRADDLAKRSFHLPSPVGAGVSAGGLGLLAGRVHTGSGSGALDKLLTLSLSLSL
mmetsp:Transcript_84736/g.141269  ORF Transcript_84736/g.141269 Transcript_84736/m.141269 type:complete len:215 (-) Transcript_84736:2-646(-)